MHMQAGGERASVIEITARPGQHGRTRDDKDGDSRSLARLTRSARYFHEEVIGRTMGPAVRALCRNITGQ